MVGDNDIVIKSIFIEGSCVSEENSFSSVNDDIALAVRVAKLENWGEKRYVGRRGDIEFNPNDLNCHVCRERLGS